MIRWGGNVSLLSGIANKEHNECYTGVRLIRRHSTADVEQDYRGVCCSGWKRDMT